MNEDKFTDLVIRITSEPASLNSNMKSTLERLANHETRLMELERSERGKHGNFKDEIIHWLVKGLIAAIGTIGTMAGAGAMLKSIFGC